VNPEDGDNGLVIWQYKVVELTGDKYTDKTKRIF
jgi:hypothetical protein